MKQELGETHPEIVENVRLHAREILELAAKAYPARPAPFLLMLAVGYCQQEGFGNPKILALVRYTLSLNWGSFRKALYEGLKAIRQPGKGKRSATAD